jgi:hypothetical protein
MACGRSQEAVIGKIKIKIKITLYSIASLRRFLLPSLSIYSSHISFLSKSLSIGTAIHRELPIDAVYKKTETCTDI